MPLPVGVLNGRKWGTQSGRGTHQMRTTDRLPWESFARKQAFTGEQCRKTKGLAIAALIVLLDSLGFLL
jgi:hypothetical protein